MHPADRLAEVREQIAALKAQEAVLRDILLAPRADLDGNSHVARVSEVSSEKISPQKVRELLSPKQLAAVTETVTAVYVRLRRKAGAKGSKSAPDEDNVHGLFDD